MGKVWESKDRRIHQQRFKLNESFSQASVQHSFESGHSYSGAASFENSGMKCMAVIGCQPYRKDLTHFRSRG